jgi:hypothetical protein
MGDVTIILQDQAIAWRTSGLAQPRKLGVEIHEGDFQHLAVLSVLGHFDLLGDSGAGQE